MSESSVYRLLKAHDLIASPAFIVMKAASEFKDKTTDINQMWQTDFTYFKIIGWGWMYLSTILARYGGVWKNKGYLGLLATEIIDYLTTKEYGFKELWQTIRDREYSLRALFEDKLIVDLPVQITSLKKPATFVTGRYDKITPIHLVRKFALGLTGGTRVRVVEFASSAHFAHLEEPNSCVADDLAFCNYNDCIANGQIVQMTTARRELAAGIESVARKLWKIRL